MTPVPPVPPHPLTDVELVLLGISLVSGIGAVLALRRSWGLPRTDGARELGIVIAAGLLVLAIGAAVATYADGHAPELRDVGAALARGALLVMAAYVAVWGIRGSIRRR